MLRILREPLIHFLILGGWLFVFYGLKNGGDGGDDLDPAAEEGDAAPRSVSRQITVSKGQLESLVARFSKVWQRPPSAEELRGLVDEYIRDEVMYRQALELGLDRDDQIVKRRMRQKLEFFTEDIAALAEPSDEDLESYLGSHPEKFRVGAVVSFRQVYLNPEKREGSLAADVEAELAALREAGASADISQAGDRSLLGQEFESETERDVARTFGKDFAKALVEVEPGGWQGPLDSGFGKHLVFVSERIDGRLPPLDEVREAVVREWSAAKRTESNEALYAKWLEDYAVTVEGVGPASGEAGQP
jgi:hypothetical protein